MRSIPLLFLASLFLLVPARARPTPKPRPNRDIQKMVAQTSPRRIESDVRKLVSFGTRNTLSDQTSETRGIGAASRWIYDEFGRISRETGGRLKVEKQTFLQPVAARVPQPTQITNLIATLPGTTDPDRIYIVSGHYDSMCTSPTDADCDAPGANDDASGVAAVLEMARVMSRQKFDATIIFMAVAGEEQGLLGSTYFAEQAKIKNLDIEAMFTNDIIGGVESHRDASDRQSVRVFAEGVPSDETEEQAKLRRSVGGENDSAARQLARYIGDAADLYSPRFGVQMVYRRDRYGRGGDHIPFLERGVPAVRFTEPHEDYTHQHQNVRIENGQQFGDLAEFVDFGYVANVTKINMAALASLASAPAKPRSVAIDTSKLTNDTTLQWDANSDADLSGYEIVWRTTTSPVWTDSVSVGKITKVTMTAKSKDNYFFGVRAVDAAGHKSPVVFPKPTK